MAVIDHFRYLSNYRLSSVLMEPPCARFGEFNSLSEASIRHGAKWFKSNGQASNNIEHARLTGNRLVRSQVSHAQVS